MSNIGWEKYQNQAAKPTTNDTLKNIEKHPFVTTFKITKDMDEHQIKFFSERNSLVEFLKKHDLMELK